MTSVGQTGFHGLAGRGSVDIVDAQMHLAPSPSLEAIRTAMDALGIRSVLFDELWGRNEHDHGIPCIEFGDGAYRPLSPLAQAAALQDPDRFAWVQRVTRRDPALEQVIGQLAMTPGCRALRLVIFDRDECGRFAQRGYDEVLSLAQASGLALCLLARDVAQLVDAVAPRFPRLRLVVDHCGWVRTPQQWESVLSLARHDNVWLKWSHFHRAFGGDSSDLDEPRRALAQAVAAFGAPRVLWAGDVTHEESTSSWAQLLAFVLMNGSLSGTDREWILGRSARSVFAWETAARHVPA